MSIPRTFTSRHFNRKPTRPTRKPARRTFAVAGSTVAAALVAGGVATANPGSPGTPVAFGADLTAHDSTSALPIAGIAPHRAGTAPAGAGGHASLHLAGGLSVVTASGRAILASGQHTSGARTVNHAHLDSSAEKVHRAAPAHKARHTGPCASSTLHWWICSAEHALEKHGVSRARLSTSAAYIVVQHESGANPHAYNGWDSNAAAGHPSEGIAQVIGPTFQAYALPGHHNIWNPVDNMIAAFRYAISRYGSMNTIPGVMAVRQGGSYMGY